MSPCAGQVPFDTSDATYKGQTEQVHLNQNFSLHVCMHLQQNMHADVSGKLAEIVQVLKLLDDILLEAGTCKQNIVKVCQVPCFAGITQLQHKQATCHFI